jgi:DNA-binding HxlR family transcriptional regulator
MIGRKRVRKAECPISRSLEVVGDSWSLLVVRDAGNGLRRFSEFEKSLGIAKNILAARLRWLVAHEVMRTAPASDGSVYLEYVLTSKGEALFPLLNALRHWGEEFCPMPARFRGPAVRSNRSFIRKVELRSGRRSQHNARRK